MHSICLSAIPFTLIAKNISPKLLHFATQLHDDAFAHKNLLLGALFINISCKEDYLILSDKDDKEMSSGLESETLAELEKAKSAATSYCKDNITGSVAHVPRRRDDHEG